MDEIPKFEGNVRSARPSVSAFPGPIETKAHPVPSDHRFGLDDH